MPLLADYAITPDVFDVASYSTEDECAARIENLREVVLMEGLVRDLRDGAWHTLFESRIRSWHRRGTELVRKLVRQGRLVQYPPALPDPPADDLSWCTEALASHASHPLAGGVIVTRAVKDEFCRRTSGCPDRQVGRRALVDRQKPVGEGRAHACRLRRTPRFCTALLEFSHVHRPASGSRKAQVPRLWNAPSASGNDDTGSADRNSPRLLRRIRSRNRTLSDENMTPRTSSAGSVTDSARNAVRSAGLHALRFSSGTISTTAT